MVGCVKLGKAILGLKEDYEKINVYKKTQDDSAQYRKSARYWRWEVIYIIPVIVVVLVGFLV